MRTIIHKLICWYLRRCEGAFHCYPYGDSGRYVVLMKDHQYSNWTKMDRVVRSILISHGMYGDRSNLDLLTRKRCLELLNEKTSATPDCPRCGNNRQVWPNQITGRMTCHRIGCQTEIKQP